jgi:TRAP-type C4-dicarboxylate transport system permease small subunit
VPDPDSKVLARLERFGRAAENTLLVLLLTAMIVLAVGQIALRELFDTGLIWADELVKLLVLWIAMLGSVAASRDDRHLRIDVLSHLLSDKMISVVRLVVEIFAAVICAVVTWHAFRWLQIEFEDGDTLLIDFPAWIAHGVLPLAFILMTYRFGLSSLKRIVHLASTNDRAEVQ